MVYRLLLLSLTVSIATAELSAWGRQGHYMASEAATANVPDAMPAFFHRSYEEIIYLSPEPDEWRNAGRSTRGSETPDHFIDLEFTSGLDLPSDRYAFARLMVASEIPRRRGTEISDIGFLPWRIAETTELLEQQWREWRRAELSPEERAHVEANIAQLAGVLGHFVADAANPLHTTMHYNGWAGSANPERYATDCDLHSRFETQFVRQRIELRDVLANVRDLQPASNYFERVQASVRESNALVGTLYRIDRDGGFRGRGTEEGMEFVAERLGAASSMLRDLWWSAWKNSNDARR
jgi:hypothetical protein